MRKRPQPASGLARWLVFGTLALGWLACQGPATTTPAATQQPSTMEPSSFTLAIGESHEIQLPSRGASGLQLLFALDPAGVVAVTRREATPAERATPHPNVGGATPAYFVLQALKPGQTSVSFFERPAPGRGGEDMPVATYQVVVSE